MARASKASAAKKAAAKKAAAKKSGKKTSKRSTKKSATSKSTTSRSNTSRRKTASKKTESTKKSAATKAAAGKKKTTPTKKAARTTKSSRAKSHFDKKFLDKMRKLLAVERETYERQAQQLRAEAASLVDSMEPGDVNFDEEGGEGDTIAVERGRDLALASKAMEMIEEIDHALAKFDDGTFGICEVSGEPIPEERLEAIPWARERVEYKVGGFGRR